jgi:hypothetical protein
MPYDPPAHDRDSYAANPHVRGWEDLHVGTVDDRSSRPSMREVAEWSDIP